MFNELNETVEFMNSSDYQKRFVAEFEQLNIRIIKLQNMLADWDANRLKFEPVTPKHILLSQLNAMKAYLNILQYRAEIEKVTI